jgi:hypothetical protein
LEIQTNKFLVPNRSFYGNEKLFSDIIDNTEFVLIWDVFSRGFNIYKNDNAIMFEIEAEHFNYLIQKDKEKKEQEKSREWKRLCEDFSRLNVAQRKSHLEYIKSHENNLTEEQLHVLGLSCLAKEN